MEAFVGGKAASCQRYVGLDSMDTLMWHTVGISHGGRRQRVIESVGGGNLLLHRQDEGNLVHTLRYVHVPLEASVWDG